MKRTIKLVALFFALALTTIATAQNNDKKNDKNDKILIKRAIGAAHECFTDGLHNLDVNGSVETLSICFVSGEIKRVTLFASPKCHKEPCPKYMSRIVATVDFGCDGCVIAVNCVN